MKHNNTLKRKNFFPTLLITALLWLLTTGLVYFIDPETFLAVPLFFILIFLGLLFTFSALLAKTRRGLLTAIGLTVFLILRYFGVGNILNFLFILAICLCVELYFNRSN